MRPDFEPSGNKNEEDIFSDEEIDKSKVDMNRLMNTHIGSTRDNDEDDFANDSTYGLSVQAMQQASRMWPEEDSKTNRNLKRNKAKRTLSNYNEADMQKLKKETQRSQAQTQNFQGPSDGKEASFERKGDYSESKLLNFLARLRHDTPIKAERCNKDRKDIVTKVVSQIIEDSKF